MCSMCHYCGAELKLKDEKCKLENGGLKKLNGEGPAWSCRICQEKQGKEPLKRDSKSPFATPMISPTSSLSSSDRSVSSCSDISVDVYSYDRYNQDQRMLDSGREDLSHGVTSQLHNPCLETPVNIGDHKVTASNLKEDHNRSLRWEGDTVRDVEIIDAVSEREPKNVDPENGGNENPHSGDDEMDAQVWEPPDAEDPADDLEGSVAFNDDDDEECGDGTKWGKPCSLSSSGDDGSGSYKFKEEKKKAMEEVINGKFKVVVSQLLKTAGIASSGKDSENWLDIITSLSWEAASFLKPDAIDGKTFDPDGYVKVKCIAAGCRSESELVKGLVFKKHAAHKHMPTKYTKPKLLLIRGELGESSSGLSSLKLMDQEKKDNLRALMEMIDTCHPNVILVEKSVSRDVQESILAKGITLVYDMKLHRLERVARCTGSSILSSDALTNQKLKQCDSFHIEKFVEEHSGLSEGGKKPSKTLMFIEGCPTRMVCTILLKGSHSEELKRIKYVVQIAVVMAYQLILETSFLVDQKAMFSTILFSGVVNIAPGDQLSSVLEIGKSNIPSPTEMEPSTIDIPISNGFHDEGSHNLNMGLEGDAALSYVPYNPVIFSGFSSLSASLKKVIGDNFHLNSSSPYQSLSSYFGFNVKETSDQITEEVPVLKTLEAVDNFNEERGGGSGDEKLLVEERTQTLTPCSQAYQDRGKDIDRKQEVQSKDDVNTLLDCQSILVLMSSRNALSGDICRQSHFSHIMFYRNFDVPLGKFLGDNLLNQKSQCTTCGQLPEFHYYYYAHRNKQLTIRVRRLHRSLPGEAEGKLWMWSCCGKCKRENGVPKSTKRVLISTAARSLSFGKFLELSLSHHSSSFRASSCGHSLERDFLYFFGLGPMAAMFKYSPVTTYNVYLPPLKMEFSHSFRHDGLQQEFQEVYAKGILLFSSVANALNKLRPQFSGSPMNLRGSLKDFSYIEDMLEQESSDLKVSIHNAVAKNLNSGNSPYKHLILNRLLWDLLLESYIWERRLHSLISHDPSVIGIGATEKVVQNQLKPSNGTINGRNGGGKIILVRSDKFSDNNSKNEMHASAEANEFSVKDIPIDGPAHESSERENLCTSSSVSEAIEKSSVGGLSRNTSFNQELHVKPLGDDNCVADNVGLSADFRVEKAIPIAVDVERSDFLIDSDPSMKGTSPRSLVLNLEKSNGWFWMPFSEIRQIHMKDVQRGFMPKFQPISSYVQEHISAAHQLIAEEGSRLHIPLGADNYFVRDYDGDLSSIIACALAFLKDLSVSAENFDYGRKEGSLSVKSTEGTHILARFPAITSSHWSSNGSSDSDSVHSALRIPLEESRFSSFDGLNLLESLVPPENLSPEVSLGFVKSLGKGRYSVICLYAKQFRDLRNRCFSSEVDFIASLSRCKNWDAKGGKSKSIFAKTIDDRFIIKEIKKTEFESFVKFAPDYFKYMNESFERGNQTCLAKVLGIYQVIIRQTKSGKEVRHDLMVMENLTFGRNITRQYDLKGALHARFNSAADGSGDVLLDQNFVYDMNNSPLYVSHKAKRLLERAVWNDTTFLNSINVMDYSLLVGVDTQRRELVCGIIDYLRQYTWDKQLETWVKSSLVVPKNLLPTVISPKEYKKRFRKFIGTYFLSVPDDWCSQRSSDPCQLCGIKDDNSSESKPRNQGEQNGFSH